MALRWIALAVLLCWSGISDGQVPDEGSTFWCAHATRGGFGGWLVTNHCSEPALALSTVENGGRLGWRLTQQAALEAFEAHAQRSQPDITRCGWTTGPFWPEPRLTGPGISSHGGETPGVYTIGDNCQTSFGVIRTLYTGCWAHACAPIDGNGGGGNGGGGPGPKNFGGCSGGAGPGGGSGGGGGPSPSNNGSNPINAATGNKYQREVDYTGSGPNPLDFTRHYNSLASYTGTVGARWRHAYERHLEFVDATTVRAHRADGREFEFRFIDGAWLPDPDVTLRLIEAGDDWLLVDESDAEERYVADGKLTALTPRGGPVQTLTYDTERRLIAVDDGHGRQLTFDYDSDDRVATMTDAASGIFAYAYDTDGNLSSVTFPDGSTRQYEYTEAEFPHALTAIIDGSGTLAGRWEYDDEGRATASEKAGGSARVAFTYNDDGTTTAEDAGGGSRIYTFDELHDVFRTRQIDGDPCVTCGAQAQQYTYDANGFVTAAVDRNGIETRYTRDARGLETQRIEAFGTPEHRTVTTQWHTGFDLPLVVTEPGRETVYTYDAAGRRLSETIRDTATGETRATSWTYNAAGQVLTMTGPRGAVTTNTYDTAGNLLTVTNALGHVTQFSDYDGHGNARRITDPNGVATTLVYDARQRLLSRTTAGDTTSFAYDSAGRLLQLTQPNGAFVDYEYDPAGRLVAIEDNLGNRIDYELDLMGNRTAERVSGSDSVTVRESFSTFDKLNRLVTTLGGEGQITEFGYDALDNPISTTDALGNATTTHYDALNRVFEQVDALSGVTQYAYNPLDQLTEVIDPRGVTTGYTYNAFGEVVSVASPDAGTTTYAYDAAGNRIRQTDARGVVTEYDYDALNRLVAIRYPAHPAQDIAYTWDAGPFGIGRLSRIDDETGSTEYQYDVLGRVTARVGTVRGTTLAHFQEFDAAGNLTSLMHPDGSEVAYARDAAGRISGIEWVAPGAEPVALVTGVTWQPFGGFAGFTYGNGIGHSRTYDLSGRVTGIASGAVQHFAYQWDATDNITAIADLVDGAKSQSFGYDPLYRLTAASGAYGNLGYGYDAVGNRTALTADGQVTTYAYAPDSNQLATVDDGTGPASFTYDAAGSTLTDGSRTFAYDARNRMTTADGHAYGYNALGQRAFKPRFGVAGDASGDRQVTEADLALLQQALRGEVSGTMAMDCNADGIVDNKDTGCLARKIGAFKNQGQHRGKGAGGPPTADEHTATPVQVGWVLFAYDDAGHLIGEYDEQGNPIRQYVWLGDLPVAVVSAEGVHYLHADHLNTPKVVTDQQGAIAWQADYNPFGEVAESGSFELNLRFPGQYHDRETGLHQNWHREYMPELGRYSQSDPIGLVGGFTSFAYVEMNPISKYDPNGLASVTVGVTGAFQYGGAGASGSAGVGVDATGRVCIQVIVCGRVGPGVSGGAGAYGSVSRDNYCEGNQASGGVFAEGGAGKLGGGSIDVNAESASVTVTGRAMVGGGAAGGSQVCSTKTICLN